MCHRGIVVAAVNNIGTQSNLLYYDGSRFRINCSERVYHSRHSDCERLPSQSSMQELAAERATPLHMAQVRYVL